MRVPNNSKFACQKGQIELYFKFKAKNLSKNYIFRNPHKFGLWGALVDDFNIRNDLIDVIKMKNNAIIEYERRIIDEAVDKNSLRIACNMRDENYSRDEILKLTGVDISTV